MSVDYKQKYLMLKSELINATDLAYRLGMEAGLKEGQQQAQAQQLADAQAKEMAMANGGQVDENGNPIDDGSQDPNAEFGGDPNQMDDGSGMPDEGSGSELDNHINELQGLVQKGAKPSIPELRKKIQDIENLRKSQKNKPRLNNTMSVSNQKSLVNNILSKWNKDAQEVKSDIAKIVEEAEKNK